MSQYTTCSALAGTYISAIRTIFLWVVSISQLVEVADSAVLGGVVTVVSSIPTMSHKNIFSAFIISLSILTLIINLYQFLILCSSKLKIGI